MERIKFDEVAPDNYKAMLTFAKTTRAKTLTPLQAELIKIRASQINSCAFCLDMHTKVARELGETERRIFTLPAWKETSFFSEEEKAILALTEDITLIQADLKDDTYAQAAKVLTEVQIAEVIMTAVVINSWNRIMKITRVEPAL